MPPSSRIAAGRNPYSDGNLNDSVMKSKLNDVPQGRLHLEDGIARETGVPICGSQGLHSKVVDTINPSLQEAMDHVFEVFLLLVGSMWIATFLAKVMV